MGRRSKQKNHLIRANSSQKPIFIDSSHSELSEEESDSSNDEVIWDHQELDEEPKGTLEKLYHGAKNLKPSKRPLRYNGNSIRTQKRRKSNAKKMAIQNGCTINQFFPPIELNESDNNESDNNEIENVDSDASSTESETEVELEELIHLIEIKLQDKTLISEQ